MTESNNPNWPVLAPEALHGIAGEVVETLKPHSEADPAALLVTLLAGFGNIIGPNAFWPIEKTPHRMNEFFVLLGETSKARKGTSLGYIQEILSYTDPEWASKRVMSGLSSGEGLIAPLAKKPASNAAPDPRLFVIEEEFSRTLKCMERKGSTLSPVVRSAWDGKPLHTMTKDPMRADHAHVSIIGHGTIMEIPRILRDVEAFGGTCNRFLWVVVRRGNILPDGGSLPEEDMERLRFQIHDAIDFARSAGQLQRTKDAHDMWRDIYGPLSAGRSGMFGAMTNRAEAHVLRLSCVYALLDSVETIDVCHLEAALALWKYAEASVRLVWGFSTGNPLADKLLEWLKEWPKGKTREEIRSYLGNNKSSREISESLKVLEDAGLARLEREGTTGRTAERWFAIEQPIIH